MINNTNDFMETDFAGFEMEVFVHWNLIQKLKSMTEVPPLIN